jgi:Ring finger domain
MSSNNTADSPLASPDSGGKSFFFQEIFILFLALSSLFVVLSLVRRFLQRRGMRRSALFLLRRNTGGFDLAAIAAMPTFPYSKHGDNSNCSKENDGSSMECPICLSAVEEGEMVKLLPKCMHLFHGNCVDLWLSGHETCPVCRVEVLGSTGDVLQPSQMEMGVVPVNARPTETTTIVLE